MFGVVIATVAVLAVGIFQHYSFGNLVMLTLGVGIFLSVLAWSDPNPELHAYKVLLAGLGAGMWVSAVRDERRASSASSAKGGQRKVAADDDQRT